MENEKGDKNQILKISQLTEKGISPSDIKNLRNSGYHTIRSVAYTSKKKLIEIRGISEAKAEKLLNEAYKIVPMGFCTGRDAYINRQEMISLTTGSQELDKILRGGIETGSITELIGEYRTGKTQLCHNIAVSAQLSYDQGGGEGRAIFLDTEGTFRPERIVDIAGRFKLNSLDVLENIALTRAYNVDQQLEILNSVGSMMVKYKFAVLIVDSIIALYRAEFIGRGELSARQQHLGRFIKQLQRLCDEFNIAVLITNQVVAQVDGCNSFVQDPKKACGGNIIAHASQTRLFLKKQKGVNRGCTIHDSPNLPPATCTFSITSSGIGEALE
ncbi:rad51 (nucleomorph) [Hemiselmis andersenii]|uniref:Rad51 n=1 Tax=Hemiselmis andersenii TaxID=464988 RepID=A9BKY9_HEMAN|nr:rad51 [Hemiselmis andersenii]ABW98144.1 rad51 [Hemiselmis andersenii]